MRTPERCSLVRAHYANGLWHERRFLDGRALARAAAEQQKMCARTYGRCSTMPHTWTANIARKQVYLFFRLIPISHQLQHNECTKYKVYKCIIKTFIVFIHKLLNY